MPNAFDFSASAFDLLNPDDCSDGRSLVAGKVSSRLVAVKPVVVDASKVFSG